MPPGRSAGIDIARGIAILGMICAHMMVVPAAPLGILVGLTHGRSAALFALLAGVSLGIMTGSQSPYRGDRLRQARLKIVGRALVLLVLVSFLSLVNSGIALILGNYAMWFLFALPFLTLSPSSLLILAGALGTVGPIISALVRGAMGVFVEQPLGLNNIFLETIFGDTLYSGTNSLALLFVGLALTRRGLLAGTAKARALAGRCLVVGALLAAVGLGGSTVASSLYSGYLDLNSFATFVDNPDEIPATGEAERGESGPANAAVVGVENGADYEYSEPSKEKQGSENARFEPGMKASEAEKSSEPAPGWDDSASKDSQPPTFGEKIGLMVGENFWLTNVFSASPHSGTTLEFYGNLGVGLLIVGTLLRAGRRLHLALLPLAAVGSLALTVYCLQLPWSMYAAAINMDDKLAYFGFVVPILMLAVLWRGLGYRGPLEWVMHRAGQGLAEME